jgi:hypothetical protein
MHPIQNLICMAPSCIINNQALFLDWGDSKILSQWQYSVADDFHVVHVHILITSDKTVIYSTTCTWKLHLTFMSKVPWGSWRSNDDDYNCHKSTVQISEQPLIFKDRVQIRWINKVSNIFHNLIVQSGTVYWSQFQNIFNSVGPSISTTLFLLRLQKWGPSEITRNRSLL